jgi:excisionase family DNA binding protein
MIYKKHQNFTTMLDQILKELKDIKLILSTQKKVWTLDEFCAYSGISKLYAYHLTSTGKVKFYRPFGKKIFFDADETIEFLKQNPVKGNEGTKSDTDKYFLTKLI